MNRISLKKRLIFSIFKKLRKAETKLHELNYLFWEPTLRCNLNCIHCGSDCLQQSKIPDMPASDFIKVCKEIKKQYSPNDVVVVITGGEPLLRNDLEECGYALTKLGFKWGIVTNGTLLSKNRIESLLQAGLSSVAISLDGLKRSHNWLRNSNSFEKVLESIELLTQQNEPIFDVVTCVNKRNIGELELLKDLLISKGVKKWRLFTISPIGRAKNNPELQLDKKQFLELMEFIKKARNEKEIEINYECEGFVGEYELEVRNGLYFCRAGINIASVLADGSISACPSIDRRYTQGNIYKDDFLEVWNNKFSVMRDRHWMKTGVCKECKVYNFCNGNGMHLRNYDTAEVLACQYNMLS